MCFDPTSMKKVYGMKEYTGFYSWVFLTQMQCGGTQASVPTQDVTDDEHNMMKCIL